jgi:acyl-CoA thioesterase FadM
MARIKIDPPKSFMFSTEISVRITDLNYANHLGNDSLLSIVHEARQQFFSSLGYSEMDVEGIGTIMSDVVLVYQSQSYFADVLKIQIGLQDISRSTFDILYFIKNKATGKPVASVKTGMVFYDYNKQRPVSIPKNFLKKVL